jgi:hypothetical protein
MPWTYVQAARWMNMAYQRDILGVPLDEYLDAEDSDSGHFFDPDLPQDFLGEESLSDYFEH